MAGFFDTLFGGGAEKEAAEKNKQALAQYSGQSLGALKETYGQGTDYLKSGIASYAPVSAYGAKFAPAADLWMGATGASGPAGTDAARAAFSTTPGYDITQKAALDAIDRRRAIGGMYASGNADIDTSNWVTKNLYETQYQPWLQNLQAQAGMGGQYTLAGAQGQAGGYGNLANLAQQYGQSQTGVYGNVASGTIDANKLQASGEAAGAKNLLGAGLALGQMALGMPPTAMMGGGGGGGGGGSYSFTNSPLGQAYNYGSNLFAPGPSTAGQAYSPYYGPAMG